MCVYVTITIYVGSVLCALALAETTHKPVRHVLAIYWRARALWLLHVGCVFSACAWVAVCWFGENS